jgi:ABC-2 type transport system ATP-binding protein
MRLSAANRERQEQPAAVAVDRLVKRFGGVRVVDSVSFSVEAGSVVGLLGPSGAGKTTLVRCALGLVPPDSGRVRINGVDAHRTDEVYRHVSGLLAGDRSLDWRLTARENVRLFASLQGIDPRDRREEHARLLDSLRLGEAADTQVGDLPRGTRREVAFACTLARETPVVFLDDPTLDLDAAASYRFRQRVRTLAEVEDRTVVLSSHDATALQEVCDHVVVLDGGRLVAEGSVEDLTGPRRRRAYRVTLSGALPAADREEFADRHGVERWQSLPDGVRFELTLDDEAAFYDLVDGIRSVDADLVAVTAVEADLEDAMLQLTDGRGGA